MPWTAISTKGYHFVNSSLIQASAKARPSLCWTGFYTFIQLTQYWLEHCITATHNGNCTHLWLGNVGGRKQVLNAQDPVYRNPGQVLIITCDFWGSTSGVYWRVFVCTFAICAIRIARVGFGVEKTLMGRSLAPVSEPRICTSMCTYSYLPQQYFKE